MDLRNRQKTCDGQTRCRYQAITLIAPRPDYCANKNKTGRLAPPRFKSRAVGEGARAAQTMFPRSTQPNTLPAPESAGRS